MIENWFSTPVYFDYINSDTIITQFLDIAKKLKQENKFSIPEDWHSQLITDPHIFRKFT